MWNRWAALALVLALCAFTPKYAAGQSPPDPSRGRKLGSLGQNYPNPFNPETFIPFTIGDDACSDGGKPHVVTARIYNVLTQLVAIPILQGAGLSSAAGQPLTNLSLACGKYVAYWDGRYINSSREAASGVYMFELYIDRQKLPVMKMFSAK
jgi:hypothetical protein